MHSKFFIFFFSFFFSLLSDISGRHCSVDLAQVACVVRPPAWGGHLRPCSMWWPEGKPLSGFPRARPRTIPHWRSRFSRWSIYTLGRNQSIPILQMFYMMNEAFVFIDCYSVLTTTYINIVTDEQNTSSIKISFVHLINESYSNLGNNQSNRRLVHNWPIHLKNVSKIRFLQSCRWWRELLRCWAACRCFWRSQSLWNSCRSCSNGRL